MQPDRATPPSAARPERQAPVAPADAAAAIEGLGQALGLSLAPGQVQALSAWLDLLLRWNAHYNLTAVRDPGEMRRQHLADCLAVVPAVRREAAARGLAAPALLDVGSGGGFPGAMIAIAMPEAEVHCLDAVGKKAAFVRQAAGALGLQRLHSHHGRVEAWRAPKRFDLVVARAFSSLNEFTRSSTRHLAPGGSWLAMKGRRPEAELAALPAEVEAFHVEPIAVPGLAADRCIVWMRPRQTVPSASG
jgi:16S rRNA (guanine527-N7)-methyltransferase